MKNKELLLKLADLIDKLKDSEFNMCHMRKSALYHLSTMPAAKKLGFVFAANDIDDRSFEETWYEGKPHFYGAARLFDITGGEAMHLFSEHEFDVYGNMQENPYYCDIPAEDLRKHKEGSTRFSRPPQTRAYEPRVVAAARIRNFVRNYNKRKRAA